MPWKWTQIADTYLWISLSHALTHANFSPLDVTSFFQADRSILLPDRFIYCFLLFNLGTHVITVAHLLMTARRGYCGVEERSRDGQPDGRHSMNISARPNKGASSAAISEP